MKKGIKTAAAVFAALLCVSLAGCKSDGEKDIGNKLDNMTESKAESILGNIDSNKTSKPAVSEPVSEPEPEVTVFTYSDEIAKADLESGLVQINDDIFRLGGYYTVAEFVEQFKDRYDITCKLSNGAEGPYEDWKDFPDKRTSIYANTLILKPKTEGYGTIHALFDNRTSQDAVPVSEEIVTSFNTAYDGKFAVWAPGGLKLYMSYKYEHENVETAKIDYTLRTYTEYLEANGFPAFSGDWPRMEEHVNTHDDVEYNKSGGSITVYTKGELNLFGRYPRYKTTFDFDPDTGEFKYVKYSVDYYME